MYTQWEVLPERGREPCSFQKNSYNWKESCSADEASLRKINMIFPLIHGSRFFLKLHETLYGYVTLRRSEIIWGDTRDPEEKEEGRKVKRLGHEEEHAQYTT